MEHGKLYSTKNGWALSISGILFLGSLIFLILLIFVLSSLSSFLDRQKSSTPNNEEHYSDHGNASNTLVDEIHVYRQDRRVEARYRENREKITIIVLGLTAIFALGTAAASVFANTIFYEQLDETRKEQRPWVSLDMTLAGPLTFDINGGGVEINIVMKNWGTQPAQNVTVNPQFNLSDADNETDEVELAQLCRQIGFAGMPIFPTQLFQKKQNLPISRNWWKAILPSDFPKTMPTGSFSPIWISLIGCALYSDVYTTQVHRTPFLGQLTLRLPEGPGEIIRYSPSMLPPGSSIPPDQLRLEQVVAMPSAD